MPTSPPKSATVAGAAGILGSTITAALLELGTKVVAFCHPGDKNALSHLATTYPQQLHLINVDLANPNACIEACNEAKSYLGKIEAHFHAAGAFTWTTWQDATTEVINNLWQANYTTAWALSKPLCAQMGRDGGGVVVFVSAAATLQGTTAGFGPYLASKSALNALVESLAAEGGKMNVRVNAVAPTIIDTPNNRDAMPDQDPSKWVHPGRLSAFMIDLASPDRQDISGAIIPVVGAL